MRVLRYLLSDGTHVSIRGCGGGWLGKHALPNSQAGFPSLLLLPDPEYHLSDIGLKPLGKSPKIASNGHSSGSLGHGLVQKKISLVTIL